MIRVKMASTDQQLTVSTERFLAEVEKRPCLWDPTHRLYREENARKLAFRLIVGKLTENVPEKKIDEMGKCLYKKWKGIREHYINMKKDPSMMEKYRSNRYFQLLAFLDPTLPSSKQSNPTSSRQFNPPSKSSVQSNIESSTPKIAAVTDRKLVAAKRQEVHKTASLQVSSSSTCAVKSSSTTHMSSPANDVSSTTMVSSDKDPECDPKTRTSNSSKRKHADEPQTTVMIDGVEFEKVTLPNGEVIVKLKEEVLEDCPPPKKMDTTEKNPPPVPMKFQETTEKQQPDPSKQMGNQNELNGNQVVSESLPSGHGSELGRTQHCEQPVTTSSPINELKITSTTTLASTAWVPLNNSELKITSTSTLASNKFHEITNQSNENLFPDMKSTPKKATASDKIVAIKDQKIVTIKYQKMLGSENSRIESVVKSSNQVSKNLGDALKSPDRIQNLQSDSKKVASIKESGSIEIPDSDDKKRSNLTTRDPTVKSYTPAKQRTSVNGPEQWSTELKRLAALSKVDIQQHGNTFNSKPPNYKGVIPTPDTTAVARKSVLSSSNQVFKKLSDVLKSPEEIENLESENKKEATFHSCSDGSQRSPSITPIKRARTNRNTEVLKKLSNNSPSADDLNISPNQTPTKKIRTNRNTCITNNQELSGSGSDDSQQATPHMIPGKMLNTNRITSMRMNDLSDSSCDGGQETQLKRVRTNRNTVVMAPNLRIRTGQNAIIEDGPGQSKLQSSKPIEVLSDDDEAPEIITKITKAPENQDKIDLPDVDEDKSFLLSLLPEMKSMTETQNFDFRLAVMEALSRAKYSNL